MNPYVSLRGISYEKQAIFSHIDNSEDPRDPLTKDPISKKSFVLNKNLKKALTFHIESFPLSGIDF